MIQRALFTERKSIDEQFEKFHAENPHVYQGLLWLCRKRQAAGHKRWSADAAIQVLRYAEDFKTAGVEVPALGRVRISDHFSACYARKMIAEFPEFDGFLELRRRRSQVGRNVRQTNRS